MEHESTIQNLGNEVSDRELRTPYSLQVPASAVMRDNRVGEFAARTMQKMETLMANLVN